MATGFRATGAGNSVQIDENYSNYFVVEEGEVNVDEETLLFQWPNWFIYEQFSNSYPIESAPILAFKLNRLRTNNDIMGAPYNDTLVWHLNAIAYAGMWRYGHEGDPGDIGGFMLGNRYDGSDMGVISPQLDWWYDDPSNLVTQWGWRQQFKYRVLVPADYIWGTSGGGPGPSIRIRDGGGIVRFDSDPTISYSELSGVSNIMKVKDVVVFPKTEVQDFLYNNVDNSGMYNMYPWPNGKATSQNNYYRLDETWLVLQNMEFLFVTQHHYGWGNDGYYWINHLPLLGITDDSGGDDTGSFNRIYITSELIGWWSSDSDSDNYFFMDGFNDSYGGFDIQIMILQ